MPCRDRESQKAFQREWLRKRRTAWLKENGPCVKCGSPDELEVDHIEQSQKVAHSVWSWSRPRRLAELAKCQVLCRKCHEKKSIKSAVRDNTGRFVPYVVRQVAL